MATTAEDIWKILAEITAKQAEIADFHAEMTVFQREISQEIKELVASQKENARQFKETERRFKETDQQFKETAQRFKETDKRFEKTEEQFKETGRIIRETHKQIGDLGGRWGRFVENMVAPACETLFLKRGIPVHQVSQRVKKRLDGKTLEIDVLVTNENHVLVVEVKSSLGVYDVKELIEDLTKFRQFFPEYVHKQLYGAVAGIEIEEEADKYAYRQGLFVLAQTGEAVKILNNENFQPKNW